MRFWCDISTLIEWAAVVYVFGIATPIVVVVWWPKPKPSTTEKRLCELVDEDQTLEMEIARTQRRFDNPAVSATAHEQVLAACCRRSEIAVEVERMIGNKVFRVRSHLFAYIRQADTSKALVTTTLYEES